MIVTCFLAVSGTIVLQHVSPVLSTFSISTRSYPPLPSPTLSSFLLLPLLLAPPPPPGGAAVEVGVLSLL